MPYVDKESFLAGNNLYFLESLYEKWLSDPGDMDPKWDAFFRNLEKGSGQPPFALGTPVIPGEKAVGEMAIITSHKGNSGNLQRATVDSIRAIMLIRAFRVRGSLMAHLDPLGLEKRKYHPELDPAHYGFGPEDYDRPIYIDGILGLQNATLREILRILKETYCGTIGFEFMHLQEPESKSWVQSHIENRRPVLSVSEKKEILTWLTRAEAFEKFLAVKYPGAKRFGLEGGESMISSLATLLGESARFGLKEAVLGMAHRGRLNVLTNILGMPPRSLFSQFQGKPAHPEDVHGSGDVKYHLGASGDRFFGGKKIHLSLTANPSHLEAVNPVVVGKVRAKQALSGDGTCNDVMGILLHGDAAFAGQGLVAETLLLSDLNGYRTGGTVHIIINNQIGFTTSPSCSRSSPFSSDGIKVIQAPVFHVNGDDPEAVYWVAKLAAEYRAHFKKDVLVDLFCYRRHGHNEMDEPSFTQPVMYRKIRSLETTRELYAKKLVLEGVITAEEAAEIFRDIQDSLQKEFEMADSYKSEKADWLEGAWTGIDVGNPGNMDLETGLPLDILKEVGAGSAMVPKDFNLNPKLERILQVRREMFDSGEGIDWSAAEALAFGTILVEGVPVRLSGQDCGRGTFSQRHAVLVDQENGSSHIPLNHLNPDQAPMEIVDSPLAEASVLGFELGYSLANPHALVIWEAQFGDFANGAQVIIDQFISSGETKWLRMSGLVMMLPHGYEGQGPEHSSARLERYLQLCAEDNMVVANCTTAANHFHILRRQLKGNVRKPLVLMTPKSLLRDKRASSCLAEFGPGTSFRKIIPEVSPDMVEDPQVRRVILCSGKVYYDLVEERNAAGIRDIAIIRQEQLFPWPLETLKQELARYPHATFVWAQEEPENMGSWTYIDRRLEGVLKEAGVSNTRPVYCGRPASAATATGTWKNHAEEQKRLVKDALMTGM